MLINLVLELLWFLLPQRTLLRLHQAQKSWSLPARLLWWGPLLPLAALAGLLGHPGEDWSEHLVRPPRRPPRP